jgi:tRNA U34 5-carboxymethylaminomethyl modifying GTPase MnmE/TrmE
VSVYLLDALFVVEPSKFIPGCLLSLSCMLQLETPHINVVTKCDLADKTEVDRILASEGAWMIGLMQKEQLNSRLKKLTEAISNVVDDYMMVSFVTLDVSDEDSIMEVLALTDHAIQYGEDAEHQENPDWENDEDEYAADEN